MAMEFGLSLHDYFFFIIRTCASVETESDRGRERARDKEVMQTKGKTSKNKIRCVFLVTYFGLPSNLWK